MAGKSQSHKEGMSRQSMLGRPSSKVTFCLSWSDGQGKESVRVVTEASLGEYVPELGLCLNRGGKEERKPLRGFTLRVGMG